MKAWAWAALILVALAGCGQPAPPEATLSEEEAARLAAVERLMGLETCADAERDYGTQLIQLTACRLELGKGKASFVISSDTIIASETESTGTLRAELNGEAGASLQVIEEKVEGAFSYPWIEDLDGDGAGDLMVPLYTAMVNTNYALWLQGADGLFVRSGELSGYSIAPTKDGYIAATGRSSAAEWETGYFRVVDGKLEEAAIVVNRAEPKEGEPAPEGPLCEVIWSAEGVNTAGFCASEAGSPD